MPPGNLFYGGGAGPTYVKYRNSCYRFEFFLNPRSGSNTIKDCARLTRRIYLKSCCCDYLDSTNLKNSPTTIKRSIRKKTLCTPDLSKTSLFHLGEIQILCCCVAVVKSMTCGDFPTTYPSTLLTT